MADSGPLRSLSQPTPPTPVKSALPPSPRLPPKPTTVPDGRPPKRRLRRSKWTPSFDVSGTKHAVVGIAAAACGLSQNSADESFASIIWIDGIVTVPRLLALKPWQRINHFPGMTQLCHKNFLARNLARMKARFPTDYAFWPRTWCMPNDEEDFRASARSRPRWFIAKPDCKSRGIGIYLFSDPSDYKPHPEYSMVIQEYIQQPLLVDGYKLDLRIYALVTSCDPLTVYVYREGIARFATEAYSNKGASCANYQNVCMHLTNFSVNKKSEKFVDGGKTGGSKRTLSWFLSYLESSGKCTPDAAWRSICRIVEKSLLTIAPELRRVYKTCMANESALISAVTTNSSLCFELLGFDIIFDKNVKPYVLEINHSPSLTCTTEVDYIIKQKMLQEIILMLNLKRLNPQRWLRRSSKESKRRLYAAASMQNTSTTNHNNNNNNKQQVSQSVKSSQKFRRIDNCENTNSEKGKSEHHGNFELVIPSADPALAAAHDGYLAEAERLFSIPETKATNIRKQHLINNNQHLYHQQQAQNQQQHQQHQSQQSQEKNSSQTPLETNEAAKVLSESSKTLNSLSGLSLAHSACTTDSPKRDSHRISRSADAALRKFLIKKEESAAASRRRVLPISVKEVNVVSLSEIKYTSPSKSTSSSSQNIRNRPK